MTAEIRKDLILLVPDKNMEASLKGLLSRPRSLAFRPVTFDLYVHPDRDPGCLLRSHDFLRPFSARYEYALVLLDQEGCGQQHRDRTDWLREKGLLGAGAAKPTEPKKAVELVLRTVRLPRSSSIYFELARKVSTKGCTDAAFQKLRRCLVEWFPVAV